jgi:hypothetical protein
MRLRTPTFPAKIEVSVRGLFLSKDNLRKLARDVYAKHRQHGPVFTDIKKTIEEEARRWAATQPLEHRSAHGDWEMVLRSINTDFVKQYPLACDASCMPSNVFRESAYVGSLSEFGDERRHVEYKDMGVEDIRSIDVWREWRTDVSGRNFSRSNKIPIWQKAGVYRPYDRHNEGLRDRDMHTASREVPIRGYDMSSITRPRQKRGEL